MRVTFLGTRGEIEARSKRHRLHRFLIVTNGSSNVMIDCGSDWTHRVRDWRRMRSFSHMRVPITPPPRIRRLNIDTEKMDPTRLDGAQCGERK
jgi:hypothetical protein